MSSCEARPNVQIDVSTGPIPLETELVDPIKFVVYKNVFGASPSFATKIKLEGVGREFLQQSMARFQKAAIRFSGPKDRLYERWHRAIQSRDTQDGNTYTISLVLLTYVPPTSNPIFDSKIAYPIFDSGMEKKGWDCMMVKNHPNVACSISCTLPAHFLHQLILENPESSDTPFELYEELVYLREQLDGKMPLKAHELFKLQPFSIHMILAFATYPAIKVPTMDSFTADDATVNPHDAIETYIESAKLLIGAYCRFFEVGYKVKQPVIQLVLRHIDLLQLHWMGVATFRTPFPDHMEQGLIMHSRLVALGMIMVILGHDQDSMLKLSNIGAAQAFMKDHFHYLLCLNLTSLVSDWEVVENAYWGRMRLIANFPDLYTIKGRLHWYRSKKAVSGISPKPVCPDKPGNTNKVQLPIREKIKTDNQNGETDTGSTAQTTVKKEAETVRLPINPRLTYKNNADFWTTKMVNTIAYTRKRRWASGMAMPDFTRRYDYDYLRRKFNRLAKNLIEEFEEVNHLAV